MILHINVVNLRFDNKTISDCLTIAKMGILPFLIVNYI